MNKENYWPVRFLYHTSKVFERIFYNQLNDFVKDELSTILLFLLVFEKVIVRKTQGLQQLL